MSATRTDGDLLLAAIVATPDCDTTRLVYADWLEENGDAVRAEFIRAQCARAIEPHIDGKHAADCPCRWCQLGRREQELLRENEAKWRRGPQCEKCGGTGFAPPTIQETKGWKITTTNANCPHCEGTGDGGGLLDPIQEVGSVNDREWWPPKIHFRRGFIDSLECTMADAVERPLYNAGHDTESYGPWQPTPWLKRVLTILPERALIREVVRTDRVPESGHWQQPYERWWRRGDGMNENMDIPPPIFDLFIGGKLEHLETGDWYGFPTRELAVSALAQAIVRWARS